MKLLFKLKLALGSIGLILVLLMATLKLADLLLPINEQVHSSARFSRIILDEHGRLLRAFADESGVWRHPITLPQVSSNYIEALLTYEDRWFWWHPGVNPVAVLRAAWQNFSCGCVVSGGSTITMQVARIFHPHSKTVLGKLSQVLRALQLEWHYSKTDILELYLNNAPFGGAIEGVQAASQTFLEKNADELTDAEAALLAVLPQAPSRLRPDRHPQRARAARDKVLKRLMDLSVWSGERIENALQESVVAFEPTRPMHAPILARQLIKRYPQANVIPTYINLEMQSSLEEYVKDHSLDLPEHSSMAILVVENKTGNIKAHVASADFFNSRRFGHVNMVSAIRSPGSTLKPFIYGRAIDDGLIHSHSLLLDAPRLSGEYRPENFNKHFNGPVSTTFALQKSLNLPAVQVLEAYGAERFYAELKNAGVSLRIPGKPNLSLALGGVGTNLADLVSLFSAFANQGQVKSLRYSTMDSTKNDRFLMNEEAAWVTYKMLSSAPRPDRVHGSMFHVQTNPIAWKTGTSYGYRDAWALGVSKNYTVGVWVGRPDGTALPGQYGALTAAPILFKVMESIPGKRQTVAVPNTVSIDSICWPLGVRESMTKNKHCHLAMDAWLANGQVPPTLSEPGVDVWRANPYKIWLDANSGLLVDKSCGANAKTSTKTNAKTSNTLALWPTVIEPWIAANLRFHGQLPKVDKSCVVPPAISVRPLSISSMEDGNQYRFKGGQDEVAIKLESVGGQGKRDWYINGRFVGSAKQGHFIYYHFPHAGEFEVVVIDETAHVDRVKVRVIMEHAG